MNFRRLWLLLFATLFSAAAWAQSVASLYHKAEYRVVMRDSVRLYTAVYSPRGGGKAPLIIFRTPYGCAPYGADRIPDNLEKGYLRSYVDRGYILVMQDVRGRYMSEGEFVHVRPAGFGATDEATDSFDTVDWLVQNIPGNNGRVGFAGCSYPGFYAMMGALSGHPAVKAVSPQAPVTDWFLGDDVHHNGVLMLSDAVRFLSSMNAPGDHIPTESMPGRKFAVEPDEGTFFLKYPALSEITKQVGENAFWAEMMDHPDYDEWWQARNLCRACYNVRPAVLVVGGMFDAEDCYGTWNLYRAVKRQNAATVCRLVVGPWAHGAWCGEGRRLGAYDFGEQASSEWYVEHFEAPFFDHYLKTSADDPDSLPAVSVFTSGDNRWRTFTQWPPRESRKTTLYLCEGGRLEPERPAVKFSSSSYVSDPRDPVPYNAPLGKRRDKAYMVADQRFLDGRKDVLNFSSEPLAGDVTLAGPVEATLEVVLSTSDADLVVKLIDESPDGGRMLVRGDVMRGRYRRGFSRPEPFTPGIADRVAFRLADIAHTFRAGHRIVVQVQSSWFPLAALNPQQYVDVWRCAASDFVPCRVTLLHQRSAASLVTVYQL